MSLRILVGVKRVIDYAVKIRVKPTGIETSNVKHSMNPFDEIAMEEAVRLKEASKASAVIAASIGPKTAQETLKTALALGADKAIHIETSSSSNSDFSPIISDSSTEPLAVAKILKALVEREKVNCIILGKQSIDDDCGMTGQMLAGLLGWSQATFASKVEVNVDGKTLNVTREIDGGLQKIKVQLPAVITTDLRLNEPRYATLQNIMKAKSKPFEKLNLESIGLSSLKDAPSSVKILEVSEPPKRKAGIKVASVDELLDKLRNEAHVLKK